MITTLMLVAGMGVEPLPPPPRVQWLLFSMQNCPACQTLKGELRPKLTKAGWKMSSSPHAQIRTIEMEKDPKLVEHYVVEMYPTLILLVDGVPEETLVGGEFKAVDIARKYNRAMEEVIKREK